jgi:hypothetical protein
MIAMVPMTLRGTEKGGDRGNQVGGTLMPVYSEIADPLERLRAISESALTSKRVTDAMGKELLRDLLEYTPAMVSGPMLRNLKFPGTGLVVSNVRGPDVPLYMAGARLVNYAPISIVIDGMGLNCTGFSYHGTMWICAVSCREMLPDPARFADCLRESFADLKQAAGRSAAESVAEAVPVVSKRAARRAPAKARSRGTVVRKKAGGKRRKSTAAPQPEA